MPLRALIKKEARLLLRDRLSAGLLLLMPLGFIVVLGLLLGEGFGQKPDNRLRISLVSADLGYTPHRVAGLLQATPTSGLAGTLGAAGLLQAMPTQYPDWFEFVKRDLDETAGIRVELIGSVAEAERLVQQGRRSAILYFGPLFSEKVNACSFLSEPGAINPFFREGVDLTKLDATVMEDKTQLTASAIIKQVGQVTLLRVILPWMIGKAFDRLSDPEFIDRLGKEVNLPVPQNVQFLMGQKISLWRMLQMAAGKDPEAATEYRLKVGAGVKAALQGQFSKYNLLGKNWADLTQSQQRESGGTGGVQFVDEAGSGFLNRGAARYQILVPAYTVMFAFTLVLPVGWLFLMERRQGTLRRLKAAPVTKGQVLLGKLVPCLAVSLFQGWFLLLAGRLLFGMTWGPESWSLGKQVLMLSPVVGATALAAMGLSMLLAVLARSEIQVALVGSLLVLVLALLSGCLIPRELMPEAMTQVRHLTPHAWALDAYRQLLQRPAPGVEITPNLEIVWRSCGVLVSFGVACLALAWRLLRLD